MKELEAKIPDEMLAAEPRLDLRRRADHNMARRALPGAFSYPALALLLGFSPPYFDEHPTLVGSLLAAALLLGGLRWRVRSPVGRLRAAASPPHRRSCASCSPRTTWSIRRWRS